MYISLQFHLTRPQPHLLDQTLPQLPTPLPRIIQPRRSLPIPPSPPRIYPTPRPLLKHVAHADKHQRQLPDVALAQEPWELWGIEARGLGRGVGGQGEGLGLIRPFVGGGAAKVGEFGDDAGVGFVGG